MKDGRLYLRHTLERCERIERYASEGRDAFYASDEKQDAVIRNLEIVGEAAKRVPPTLREQLSGIDWRGVCGMRDVLIHDYVGVDLDEVWNVCEKEIPPLRSALAGFLGPAN